MMQLFLLLFNVFLYFVILNNLLVSLVLYFFDPQVYCFAFKCYILYILFNYRSKISYYLFLMNQLINTILHLPKDPFIYFCLQYCLFFLIFNLTLHFLIVFLIPFNFFTYCFLIIVSYTVLKSIEILNLLIVDLNKAILT